jgi:CRISPR system Cascade subunit CasA
VALNLVHDVWIPIIRRDGSRAEIAPHDIVEVDIVRIDWPRTDLRLAQHEWLIGLLATAYPPADDGVWLERWHEPPTPDELRAAFAPYAHAFDLDGDGPRFGQDFEAALVGEPEVPEALLLDTPGDSTVEKNRDLMVRPDRFQRLSRAAAAIALYTLQTYAPQGGSGHRMSVRDGAPLTTLVLPGGDPPLWRTLWANVTCGQPAPLPALANVFPWLAPTRVSPAGEQTTEIDAHQLQCWWGTPRRIRLVCKPAPDGASCDLTGEPDTVLVTGRIQLKHGVNYAAWQHPLTPYQQNKDGGWRACRPDRAVGYRHWAALVTGSDHRRPAAAISAWNSRVRDLDATMRDQTRLLAAGFACKQAKVEAFVESEMPLPGSANAEMQQAMAHLARRLIAATSAVQRALARALRPALADTADLLWQHTETRFYQILRNARLADGAPAEQPLMDVAPSWRSHLTTVALALFDEARPLLDPAVLDPARIVKDRKGLTATLHGYGAHGKALFEALMLPLPKGKH